MWFDDALIASVRPSGLKVYTRLELSLHGEKLEEARSVSLVSHAKD